MDSMRQGHRKETSSERKASTRVSLESLPKD